MRRCVRRRPTGSASVRRGTPLLVLMLLIVSGCTQPGEDAASRAVEETRSAVVSAQMAVRFAVEGRSSDQVAQVVVRESVAAVAQAQADLAGTDGVPADRLAVASEALRPALDLLIEVREGTPQPSDADRLGVIGERLAAADEALRQ